MKRKWIRKTLAVLLAAAAITGTLAGCGKSEEKGSEETTAGEEKVTAVDEVGAGEIDTSEFKTVTMYLIGAPTDAYERALAKLNEKAKEDLNCELKVKFIGWGEVDTKYPLMLSGGEKFDLIYTANWLGFINQASKGAFMPIEDLASQYAPVSYASMPEEARKAASVDGHLYAITPNFSQYATNGYEVRGDLMKKYGMTEISSMEDYVTFLKKVKENDPQLDPSGFDSLNNLGIYMPQYMGYYNLTNMKNFPLVVDPMDGEGKIVNYIEDPRMEEFYKKTQQWAEDGCWGKNVLSNKDSSMLEKGTAASKLTNFDVWVANYRANPEFDLQFYPAYPHGFLTSYIQDAMAVSSTSENPERALMLLDKLRNDQEYYDLLTYGIKDIDYTVDENNEITMVDPAQYSAEGFCMQGFKNEDFIKTIAGSPDNMDEVKEAVKETGIETPFVYFTFNTDAVKNEVAAVQNVMIQYECPLSLGYVEDPEAGLAELREQLQKAGVAKIQEELQRQVTEFLGENK